ncbi:MAG: hypothetical protein D3903_09565 [Candidatus Electrothrix sp. GM3_4]|nr:hypothetical protein [Candidatus Electrothrix sp. GM3_4]
MLAMRAVQLLLPFLIFAFLLITPASFSFAATYTASPQSTIEGKSYWSDEESLFNMFVTISGSTATYKVSKKDDTVFTSSGTMYLNVGTGEAYGIHHDTQEVTAGTTTITLTDNLDNYSADTYPKDFYARYESDEGGWAWVGPITITRAETPTASGSITSPSTSAQGNLTVSCNADDTAGIGKVSIFFVPNGDPLVMCENGTSNPCSTISGNWTEYDINPQDYGVTAQGEFTLGLWIRNENGEDLPLDSRTVDWSPEQPPSGATGSITSPGSTAEGNFKGC